MDVKTVCLGLLCFREACGYDLKKEFESLFKHFYPAGCGSIYPALASLAEEGLVVCHAVPQEGKPDRKVYRVTDRGRERFTSSLRKNKPQHKIRSEFLATVYFAELMEPDEVRNLLASRLDDLHNAVAEIDELQQKLNMDSPAGAQFVAGFGSAVAKSAAEYIESHQHLLVGTETQNKHAGGRV